MTAFRTAAGFGEDWPAACEHCLQTLGELPAASNFGIVYAGGALAHALDLIAVRLAEATGIETWVGSGGAEICSDDRREDRDGTLSVLTAALPPPGFRLFDGLDDLAGRQAGDDDDRTDVARLALVHGDPRQTRTPSAIERLGASTGAFLIGGLTSAGGSGAMQIAGRPTEGGLSGVLLSSAAIPAVTGLTQGCTPIGPVRDITGSDGAWITTLDGRPALDALKDDVGPMLARRLDRLSGFILAARPDGGLDRGDYLVRDLGDIDTIGGRVMVGDDLRPGDRLCFVKRDPEGARADLRRLARDLLRQAEGRPVLAALMHSSIGRSRHLFGTGEAELAIVRDELGPIPLCGFRTHGEIYRDRLYGYSAVLTLFLGEGPS